MARKPKTQNEKTEAEAPASGGVLAKFLGETQLPALSPEAMANAMQQAENEASTGMAGGNFLDFSGKTGAWRLGRDKVAPEDTLFIIEPQSFFRGWKCWKDNGVAGVHQWSIYTPEKAILEQDLEYHGPYGEGDGWAPMLGFGGMIADQYKESFLFNITSKSGINAVTDLMAEIRKRMGAGEPDIPVFSCGEEKFTAHGKKNSKPVFEIEAWVTRSAVEAFVAGGDVDALLSGEEKPKGRKR